MAFHACDGIHFERLGDGSVRITRRIPILGPLDHPTGDQAVMELTVIEPGTWASVMASVSARGEDSNRWERAKRFHGED